ncbi:YbjN domain-containing protein [Actinomyces sp. 2119]|uniref:YbjN domain-containing protein n=1 Tax=Actinomyces lilanjuaniae TaxID=2321394 RepID=A0ABM6Z4H6_9ACTO|nr:MULTISPECIES: YbjN domain-containing protein [Actinomyces]AYD90043.1 YbjN domain-containing protein [Actinomyces lilanjuaniae]RJF42546.1 YbjN domain-containing protein [Actinomyces sp. 2119]
MPSSTTPTPVDAERVRACVQALGLRYFVDDEGDVGIPWRYVTVHVIFQDTRAVQLRGVWHRIADTDHLEQMRALVEEWNVTRIGPKAYVTVADGGVVRLHGEVTYPLKAKMTDQQLSDFVFNGCRLIVTLMREAENLFPDPLRGRLEP